jgi:uncharacterized BrkB/YihY/UPF0761 family membrane protein
MKQIDTRYWIELVIITLVLIAGGWILFDRMVPGYYAPGLPYMLGTIVILTIAGQAVLTRLLDKKFSKFASAFQIYKGLKILVLMVFMIIYATVHRDQALGFLGGTFIMYLVFMIFESRSLNRHSRKQAER